jgi:hypothetical protein
LPKIVSVTVAVGEQQVASAHPRIGDDFEILRLAGPA